MKSSIKRIYTYMNILRVIVPVAAFITSKNKNLIIEDMLNLECEIPFSNKSGIMSLSYALLRRKEFRNIFYYRINNKILSALGQIFLKPLESLEISGDIKGGIVIHHGHSSVISPYKVGKNFTAWQHVTIGRRPKGNNPVDTPTIGDNVKVFTGSIVLGDIKIGNNVHIGAGSIVTKSVPDNCVVIGNPARIVKRNGIKVNEPL